MSFEGFEGTVSLGIETPDEAILNRHGEGRISGDPQSHWKDGRPATTVETILPFLVTVVALMRWARTP